MEDLQGYMWEPQKTFMECSGGLSIGEWCSKARDICCAVCPQPPITGPATTIVWTLGTFLNLIMVMILTQEAPYNLALQVIGTNGCLIAVVIRTFRKGGGLNAFHYYYIPLYVTSCVPLAVAASLTSVSAMHGFGGGDAVKHGTLYGTHNPIEYDEHGIARKGYLVKHPKRDKTARKVYAHHGLLDARLSRDSPRPLLARTVAITWGVHIMLWIIVFFWVYLGSYPATQENCNEKYGIDTTWRIAMGVLAASWVIIAILFWIPLLAGVTRKNRHSSLMMIARATHSKKFVDYVWTHQSRCRYIVGGTLFIIWASGFIAVHIKALTDFLLLGDDPFDFGQLNWVISSLAIIFVIGRSVLDYRDATRKKHEDLHRDAHERSEHRRTHGLEADSPVIGPGGDDEDAVESPGNSLRRDSGRLARMKVAPSQIGGLAALTQHNPKGVAPRDMSARNRAQSAASSIPDSVARFGATPIPSRHSSFSSHHLVGTRDPVTTPRISLSDLPSRHQQGAPPPGGDGVAGPSHAPLRPVRDPDVWSMYDAVDQLGRTPSHSTRGSR